MLLGPGGGRSISLCSCRLLCGEEGGSIALAWTTWCEGASAPKDAVMGWPVHGDC